MMAIPSQKPLKFPATRPERMLSDAPPSRDEVTTSWVCRDSVEVKTFTSSGMIAPARVPQEMTADSFHQSESSPPRSGMRRYEDRKVRATETIDVSHTSAVR